MKLAAEQDRALRDAKLETIAAQVRPRGKADFLVQTQCLSSLKPPFLAVCPESAQAGPSPPRQSQDQGRRCRRRCKGGRERRLQRPRPGAAPSIEAGPGRGGGRDPAQGKTARKDRHSCPKTAPFSLS